MDGSLLDEEDENCSEVGESIKPLNAKLEDLQTCNDLVGKHGAALQRSIGEIQETEDSHLLLTKLKTVNEKSTLFRITANAMISVSININKIVLIILSFLPKYLIFSVIYKFCHVILVWQLAVLFQNLEIF